MPAITRSRSKGIRRQAIEQNLLEAVGSLLQDGWSFTELSVQRITEEAGIPRSTFYLHFPDKAQLVMRLTEDLYGEIFKDSLAWWEGDHHEGPDGIAAVVATILARYRAHFPVLRAVMETAAYEPTVDAFYRERIQTFAASLVGRLQEARAAGQLHPGVDIEHTTQFICWATERTLTQHILDHPNGEQDAQVARAIGRSIWLGLYGDARCPPKSVELGP